MTADAELAPVALAVAPNGGRLTTAAHPAVPTTPDALARTAAACREAGAAMIHVHVRDGEQRHLLDAEAYGEATRAIRAAVGDDLVIQITSEALGVYGPDEQMAVVRAARSEAVSLALRELVPDASHEAAFSAFLADMAREGTMIQFILYAPDEAARLGQMRERGLLPLEKVSVLYVLGRYTPGQKSGPADLLPFLAPDMPRFDDFMLCAFGAREAACATAGALLGGHARIGFENNRLMPDGTTAPDNAALIGATKSAIEACGLRAASADELRALWRTR